MNKIKMIAASALVMIPAGIILTALMFAMMWLAAAYDYTAM